MMTTQDAAAPLSRRLASMADFMASSPSSPLLHSRASGSGAGAGQRDTGLGIVGFLTAVGVSLAIFVVQFTLFLLLRNRLARIFKPKTFLVPERERTESPPQNSWAMLKKLVNFSDREIIKKSGLDAYFFLRYLKTLLVIFIPICAIVLPVLIPLNYIGGKGHKVDASSDDQKLAQLNNATIGLDTLAWGNITEAHTSRYAAHLLMAILVVIWVSGVFFFEMKAYIKVRQDYLTSAEHRLRASATTVLINSIPEKWLTEEALTGLFDVFPGGVRNVWLNRDLSKLLDKISLRDDVHAKLESAETELIKAAKKAQLKQRDADDKKHRKKFQIKALTKKEKIHRKAEEDAKAQETADKGEGVDSGNKYVTPHTVAAGLRESLADEQQKLHSRHVSMENEAVPTISEEVSGGFQTTNGLVLMASAGESSSQHRNAYSPVGFEPIATHRIQSQPNTPISNSSTRAIQSKPSQTANGNTVRKLNHVEDMYVKEETRFWQFWKPPSGGYASPVPQGPPSEELLRRSKEKKTGWALIKTFIPFVGGEDEEATVYPCAHNPEEEAGSSPKAEWEKYLKKKNRPTHHLPLFGVNWMFGMPWVTKKVDTIYWCREQLARLNLEIEEDQKHPERFPLLPSAFIQFNHQVAAHMACQSAIHHIPKQMTPKMVEISPRDVLWDNMAIGWWQGWIRSLIVFVVVVGMIVLWAIPVAWTAALSQLSSLIETAKWLSWLRANKQVGELVKSLAGVLPAAMLGLLLVLLPLILEFLGGLKGAKTGAQRSEFVQIFYFIFLFFQVVLVVSIASFFAKSLDKLVDRLSELKSVNAVLVLLADNLPSAANYFFSYMILQALSTSSGTLLQIGTLIMWFIIAPMFDSTARDKWKRNTNLNQIQWGSFFPVYTNFACIGLLYCVIAPLITIFAIITFGLLWCAHRYSMVYVTRFELDTGGVLYPRAINQTFTGLYIMELCLAGLFFLELDQHGNHPCTPHGTIMLVVLILTAIYQYLLNQSFSPLFRYLPITFEDEAVLRDEVFQRAQDRRFGLIADESEDESDDGELGEEEKASQTHDDQGIELRKIRSRKARNSNPVAQMGTWARDGGRQMGHWAKDGGNQLLKLRLGTEDPAAAEYRRQQRKKDLEAQRAMGDALYGGMHDEIEDLTPEERDRLTRHAFLHKALRARRPTVWIPRDDLGVSDDEIRQTKAYSDNIWISNEGTALDSKQRVVYGKNPPDFSEVDVINL